MRLIGDCKQEKEAFGFQSFLKKEGIHAIYETATDPITKQVVYRIWIVEEDDIDKAVQLFAEFQQNPGDTRFAAVRGPLATPPPPPSMKEQVRWRVRVDLSAQRPQMRFTVTGFFILTCCVIFLVSLMQLAKLNSEHGPELAALEMPPVEQLLIFDISQQQQAYQKFFEENSLKNLADIKQLPATEQQRFMQIQKLPQWQGIYPMLIERNFSVWSRLPNETLFAKIRQGQLWRLFTPVLLHGSFLHILFNMMAFVVLGREIERRIGKTKYLWMIVLTAVLSNIAQYLVAGPLFLGFSGVICGLAGFIWVRQKKFPWEGYPIPRKSLVYLAILILSFLGIEILVSILRMAHITTVDLAIANTAHIVGAMCGIALGYLPKFVRSNR